MLPDPQYPVFTLSSHQIDTTGTTHLNTILLENLKHIALFIIADHPLHEPHPLFQKFVATCKPFKASLRLAILARGYRIGGIRSPSWANEDDDILFLATNAIANEKVYGLNGKAEMGVFVVRPDGYVAYSDLVDLGGKTFDEMGRYLERILVKL
jgi:hypothetical protein